MYDYGARNYDPALGRWINPDTLSDEYPDYSPYVYAFNDPVRHIDPDGNAPEDRLGEIDPPSKKKQNIDTGSIRYKAASFLFNIVLKVGELGAAARGTTANTPEEKVTNSANGLLFIIDNSLFVEGVMSINRAPSDGEFNANYAKGTVEAETKVANINGNSKASTNSQHGYEITNETKGERHKVGVSGGELNKNGTSRRANSQVNSLNNKGGDTYSAKVKVKDVPSRTGILNWEQKQVDTHHQNTGTTAPGQKRPKPTGT